MNYDSKAGTLLHKKRVAKNRPLLDEVSFNVGTYTVVRESTPSYCHWSEGLKMIIEKNGVTIKLESEEIEKLVRSLPRTMGGSY